jgi:phosphoribosylanthranilate isomerase
MEDFEPMANRFLFDSKTPEGAKLPGGNALAFDWGLMRGQSINKPWFLAGGLNSKNVKEALLEVAIPQRARFS